MAEPVRLICHEAPLVDLLADLAVHKLDVVLADSPISPTLNIRAYNHILGESGISFFATPAQAETLKEDFPANLDGTQHADAEQRQQPAAQPGSLVRTSCDQSVVVAEFNDRALMKAFGEHGIGVFSSPSAVEQDVLDKYGVTVIGRTQEITERYYLISAERRIKHPAVSAITEAARNALFV